MKIEPSLSNSQQGFGKPKTKFNPILQNLGAPHIDSFNYMLDEGITDCINNLSPIIFDLVNGDTIELSIEDFTIVPPQLPSSVIEGKSRKIYPSECRQRYATYKGQGHARIGWKVNGVKKLSIERDMGEFPIMLKSNICNLNKLDPKQLIERGEHDNEWGGYFISKGNERLIRMLLMTRRNYPIVIKRNSWKDRGEHFSETGIIMRCVHTDQTSKNNVMHFLNNGTVKYMFSMEKRLSYVPIVLLMKCLVNYTDEKIFSELIKGFEEDLYYRECIQNMLREVHEEGIHTHKDATEFFGDIFRSRTIYVLPKSAIAFEVTQFILKNAVFIHLDNNVDKFNLLKFMLQKLFHFIENKSKCENVDCIAMMDLMVGGHLYQKIIKEKLEGFLQRIKFCIFKRVEKMGGAIFELSQSEMTQSVKNATSFSENMGNFLATGNLPSKSGLGMMQSTGLVILAENINRMRYMSHFRAVHRGSFFVEMRTTEARQLLPDAWGFICPVHTPDGSPCGLLNHLTVNCVVTKNSDKEKIDNIEKYLAKYGMNSINATLDNYNDHYPVMLEGKLIGYIKDDDIQNVANMLRILKIDGVKVPNMMEIVLVPKRKLGQYAGLYLFVSAARMARPVLNIKANQIEYIGTFEQVYLDVCIKPEEAYPGITTHMELSKTDFLSNLANLIPMPDCNQSPRNMYQCQMGKQTMGTPCHNFQLQSFTKLYRLQTPGTPLFRPVHHDNIELDDFAMGTNAVVAVISYTGYDMEDAMIINKSAIERGFAHGSILSTLKVEIDDSCYFARDPYNYGLEELLGTDGLPQPGITLQPNSIIACYFDVNISAFKTIKFTGHEPAIVDNVKICAGYESNSSRQALISYRYIRNPSVGDKFASRAGQKGICSQKWPAEDLPFTDSGLIPDIVFNPHGFPSRMTIAMMIETMAGKTAAINGLVHDATPFKFTEDDTAINYFGKLLEKSGYNYYGTEKLYSGIDGREMEAEIFFGVVHYQRLRHMVFDKWQVRSTGTLDAITHQPIKGRKRGGGVRFGEMERDALISHGASFLLQDRLLHCSDKTSVNICKKCGTLLSPIEAIVKRKITAGDSTKIPATCKLCQDGTQICNIEIPYIFKYLVTQLSSLNINVKLNLAAV